MIHPRERAAWIKLLTLANKCLRCGTTDLSDHDEAELRRLCATLAKGAK